MGGVGSYEPTLVRAVKTPGPKWDRKHRGEGQGREGGSLEAGLANLGVPLGSTDTVLGHTACTIAPFLGLSFPICKKSKLIRCLEDLGTAHKCSLAAKPPPHPALPSHLRKCRISKFSKTSFGSWGQRRLSRGEVGCGRKMTG